MQRTRRYSIVYVRFCVTSVSNIPKIFRYVGNNPEVGFFWTMIFKIVMMKTFTQGWSPDMLVGLLEALGLLLVSRSLPGFLFLFFFPLVVIFISIFVARAQIQRFFCSPAKTKDIKEQLVLEVIFYQLRQQQFSIQINTLTTIRSTLCTNST